LPTTKSAKQLRLRVFAGPNGSGKSTVVEFIRKQEIKGYKIDFGYYVNADDIAVELSESGINFQRFGIKTSSLEFKSIAMASGLVGNEFTDAEFLSSFTLRANRLTMISSIYKERLAQIIADFLRKKLLKERKKFSFETVFSHPSKLQIMRDALAAGYKVYLYFVSTESPKINVFRVLARKAKGGHDVPEDKIRSRYYRSMTNLFDACLIADQAYFFDNSVDGADLKVMAQVRRVNIFPSVEPYEKLSNWFINYYMIRQLEYYAMLES
jgi:predicted ABC-type ATPase